MEIDSYAYFHTKKVMEYGIRNVDIKILEYISQAAESRVNELLEPMIQVSRHRTGVTSSQILSEERKMKSGYELKVSSKNTVKKTLDDLEKQELALETELKAELPEEGEEVLSDTPDGKKKKYKPISKKELPDNIKQKMINTTALLAAGGEMKSWMMGAGSDPSSSGLLKSFPVKSKTAASSRKRKDESAEKPSDPALKGMRVMQKDRITLKDAMAALETDPHLPRTSLFYKWLSQLR